LAAARSALTSAACSGRGQGLDNCRRVSVDWNLIDEKEPTMSGYESPSPEEETTGTTGGETGGATGGGAPGDPDAMGADDGMTG